MGTYGLIYGFNKAVEVDKLLLFSLPTGKVPMAVNSRSKFSYCDKLM